MSGRRSLVGRARRRPRCLRWPACGHSDLKARVKRGVNVTTDTSPDSSLRRRGLDAYVLGQVDAFAEYDGVVIAVVLRSDDVEDEVVVGEDRSRWTADAVEEAIAFQERFDSEIVIAKGRGQLHGP